MSDLFSSQMFCHKATESSQAPNGIEWRPTFISLNKTFQSVDLNTQVHLMPTRCYICITLRDLTKDQLFLPGGNTYISVFRIAQRSGNTFCMVTHKNKGNHLRPSHWLCCMSRALPLADLGESPTLLRQGWPKHGIFQPWNKRRAFHHTSKNILWERFVVNYLN